MLKFIKTKSNRIIYLQNKVPIKELIGNRWVEPQPIKKTEIFFSKDMSYESCNSTSRNFNVPYIRIICGTKRAAKFMLSKTIGTLEGNLIDFADHDLNKQLTDEQILSLFCETTAFCLFCCISQLQYSTNNNELLAKEVYELFVKEEFINSLKEAFNLSDDLICEYSDYMETVYKEYIDVSCDSNRKDYECYFPTRKKEDNNWLMLCFECFMKRYLCIVFSKNKDEFKKLLAKKKISFKDKINVMSFFELFSELSLDLSFIVLNFKELSLLQ